jgi:gliding motility-associated-like protein
MIFYKRLVLVFVINCLIFNSLLYSQNRSGSKIEDFTITITFAQTPVNGPVINKAPLKYNKDFALILHMDDGDPAIHDQVMPYFKGQNGNPGLFFNERPGGDKMPFKMDAACYSFNSAGEDVHDYVDGYLHWDNLINLWAGEFGLVSRGLTNPPSTDAALEVQRNASFTKRQTASGTIPDGAEMHIYVIPPDGSNQLAVAKANNLAVFSSSPSAIPNPARVEDLPVVAGIELARGNIANDLFNQVNNIAAQCDAENHYIATFYNHGFDNGEISFTAFKSQMDQIALAFGSDGDNSIWSGSSTEIFEYLRIKELVTVIPTYQDNILTLKFSGENIPDNFRFYALTIVVEGESNIVDMVVDQPDNISTYQFWDNNALINMKWDGYVDKDDALRAEAQVTLAETVTTNANALVAMDYVQMLPEGEPKQLLKDRLCALNEITYEPGFCPPSEFLGADTALCYNDALSLQAPVSASYLWSTNETTQSIEIIATETTAIWAQITDDGGFTSRDTIQITVNPLPIVVITPDTLTINPREEVTLVASGAVSYLWSNDSTTAEITVTPLFTTDYSVIGTSAKGCKNDTSAHIIVEYITDLDFSFDTVCFGDTTHLISMITTNDSVLISEWDVDGDGLFNEGTGDTLNIVIPTADEHLTGLRIKTYGGAIHIVYHKVIVADYPQASFIFQNTCEGETIQFTDNSTLQVGRVDNWLWDFGDGNSSVEKNPGNFYETVNSYDVTLIVASNYGCADTIVQNLSIKSSPFLDLRLVDGTTVASEQIMEMTTGSSLTFEVISTYDSLEWSGGVKTETFKVINAGYFSVVIYDYGCNNSRFFTVTENGNPVNPTVGIMNLLTPNGDGFNDVWIIEDLAGISPAKVAIYARSGNLVYESNAYDNTWNGYYNGNPLPEGSYFYVIEGAIGTVLKGTISIIR